MTSGSRIASGLRYDGIGHMETLPSSSIVLRNNVRKTKVNFWCIISKDSNEVSQCFQSNGSGSFIMASDFRVDYIPEKSGFYDINVYCGNILLNEGHSFRKEVKAGTIMYII